VTPAAASASFYFRDKDRKGYLLIEQLKEASPEAFRAANRKGDGRLTLQEYVNALFIDFDKADTDKDGNLTFEEIEVYSRTTGR
jgi:Ca2+-binding EF-hand superfamily protein